MVTVTALIPGADRVTVPDHIGATPTQMRALIESMAALHAKFWNKNKRVERVAADATPLGMCAR